MATLPAKATDEGDLTRHHVSHFARERRLAGAGESEEPEDLWFEASEPLANLCQRQGVFAFSLGRMSHINPP
jgi:hypothetical protein